VPAPGGVRKNLRPYDHRQRPPSLPRKAKTKKFDGKRKKTAFALKEHF